MISRRDVVKLGAAASAAPAFGSTLAQGASAIQTTPENTLPSDTPMYRGNAARTGEMPGPAPDASQGVDLRWQFQTGGQLGTPPAVVDGAAYFGSSDGNLYALSVQDGTERWRFSTGDRVGSGPAVAGGVVYVGSEDQWFYAVDTSTGEERWRFEIGPFAGSPAVADGVILISGGAQGNVNLAALDSEYGTEVWRFASDSYSILVPAVANGTVFFSTGSYVHALDLRTGEEIWRATGEGRDQPFSSELAVVNGTVYVSDPRILFALNAFDGTERWRTSPDQFAAGSFAVAADTVFTGNPEYHTVAATNARDGSKRWLHAVGGDSPDLAKPSRYGVSNVAVADGTVFATRAFNEVYAFDTRDGSERWMFQLTASGKNVQTAPVIVDGLVLIGSSEGSDGTLYALGAA